MINFIAFFVHFCFMEFKELTQISQLNDVDRRSGLKLQVIFKHSINCSTSMMAKRILLSELVNADPNKLDVYYLDLINHRDVSNHIAVRYFAQHESPQLLVIKEGKCIYNASHSDVSLTRALEEL